MSEIKNILKRIRNFNTYFSEKYVASEYTHAWRLNKYHGINLNPLSPFSAFILKYAVRQDRPETILEIGTSGGYSALCMASTLARVQSSAHIYTIEKSAPKAEIARVHIHQSSLKNITLFESDAIEIINRWQEISTKPIDLLFLDADRKNYLNFLEKLEPYLSSEALVIADNVTSHPEDVRDFVNYMKTSGKYETYVVPFSKGLLVGKKK
jgi:predicted O-methyltransferase YrrM